MFAPLIFAFLGLFGVAAAGGGGGGGGGAGSGSSDTPTTSTGKRPTIRPHEDASQDKDDTPMVEKPVTGNNNPMDAVTTGGFRLDFFALNATPRTIADINFAATPDETTRVAALNYAKADPIWEGGPQDQYAVRAQTEIRIDQSGTYTFFLTSDDGSAMLIDSDAVLSNDGRHAAEEQSVTLELEAGTHAVEVMYFEAYGSETLMLDWQGPDTGNARTILAGDNVAYAGDMTQVDAPPVVVDDTPIVEEPADPIEPPVTNTDDEPPVVVDSPAGEEPADPTPTTGGQDTDTSGGETTPTNVTSSFSVAGGRVTTLQVNNHENVESIRLLSDPSHGNLTVNPDNTLALVLSHEPDFSGRINFSYEVTYSDNTTEVHGSTVNVQSSTQGAGWGQGNFYMLEEDENGDVVVEHGDNHRAVHISGSNDALSLSDIAALEGLSTNQISAAWLQNHPEYGSNPDMALDEQAGMRLWSSITGSGSEPSSNWLLFERGYEYNNVGNVIDWGTVGEDPLHPVHITAYGSGAKPVLNSSINLFGDRSENVVFSDLSVTGGITSLSGSNLIFDNMEITNDSNNSGMMGLYISGNEGVTLRNSSITDVYMESPSGSNWAGNEMASGLLMGNNDNVLVEGNLFDHNGWAPDYRENMSGNGGQPPNVFSHNVYIDWNNTDVTFRDNITMQAANNGMMIRSGGFIEDNAIIDNNSGGNFAGGDWEGSGKVGNFTLFADNIITSAGYRESAATGGLAIGFQNTGMDTTLLDNIIAHLADPNNPEEYLAKASGNYPVDSKEDPFFDDTIVYNWEASGQSRWGYDPNVDDRNTEGLNTSVLDTTTIQRFTQQLLGDANAGISDLADFLRAQADGSLDDYVDADLIVDFFQTGFGVAVEGRLTTEELRFIPNELGDGIRWDNRLNWSSEDLPGTISGDSVNLGGNWVNYGGTTTIENLGFGSGGQLDVNHGRLNVEGDTTVGESGATLDISNVGQIWMNGYNDTDTLHLNVDGGRFANTGDMSGNTQTTITDGQAILATEGANYDVEAGSSLHIVGSDAKVGFDGETGDTAVLRLAEDGTLRFTADSNGFSGIEEFRSGALGDAPDVASGANLGLGGLEINLSNLGGTTGSFDLLSVDEMIGELSNINITGLAGNRNAELVIDYETDKLMLNITGGGNGRVNLSQIGEETDMDHADSSNILAALTAGQGTYSDDLPTDLEVNGEEMVLADMLV